MRLRDSVRFGRRSEPRPDARELPDQAIIEQCLDLTMTSPERLQALIDGVRHCARNGLDGAFAECGVWRGGSIMAMILTLMEAGNIRDVYLYDTFTGMTKPGPSDVSSAEGSALERWREAKRAGARPWEEMFGPEAFSEEQVRTTLLSTGYPSERLHFIAGDVEQTIPSRAPESLALLRLDTDWYASTRHELVHLYPRLSRGGVLIIDDYGHWDGCRQAVDEYFEHNPPRPLLSRIDYTGRIGIKP